MEENKDLLTVSNIKYLLTIKKLSEHKKRIKSIDIAKILDVSRPSVHRMMDFLKERDIIFKDNYTTVLLTEKGENLAELYDHCYEFLNKSIIKTLSVDINISNGIYTILSELSVEQLELIHNLYKKTLTS